MRRSWQHGFAFSRARRSGGRQALQLPRASNPRGSLNIHLRPDRVPQKSEFPALVLPSPIRRGLEGVRPSSSPEHQILEEVQISIFAPRPAEVGISRFGFALPHPKRSGGRQALQHPRASNPCGSSNIRLRPDRVPQKSEVADRAVLLPCEEVWRASGPPAPASIKSLRKFNLPPPSRVLFLLRIVENLQSTVKML